MATPIPLNAAPFTLDEMAHITAGRILRSGLPVSGISTDSRTLAQGAAFVALTGESFDGHKFVPQAAERGAAAFVISRDLPLPERGGVILVEDSLAALGALARAHRDRWAARPHPLGARAVVAIGGSAGKTTTTRVIAALLAGAERGEVHATAGNLNNAIGVPMTLLGLEDRHRFAVVEIVTNHRF
jgi:UDP-N-acetylmuramoyl-tripeptide--D-alanyl-D-alanine ligase